MSNHSLSLAETETLRHAELPDLVNLLKSQADVKFDAVVNAAALRYEGGLLVVEGGALGDITPESIIDGAPLPTTDVQFRPTANFEDQVGEKLGIPQRYIRRMRDDAVAELDRQQKSGGGLLTDSCTTLLDHNVNHWLRRDPGRRFLVRAFHDGDVNNVGVARALVSDQFGMIDHMDVLLAALEGVKQSGAETVIESCDLTPNNMQVRLSAPNINALAPLWLKGYKSPFDEDGGNGNVARWRRIAAAEGMGYNVGEEPIVHAGLVIRNSETGGGAAYLAPEVIVRICRNGLTIKADAMRAVHLGSKLDDGIVRFTADTNKKQLDLIIAKARDAVASFLSEDYLQSIVDRIESKAGESVKDPAKVVERVAKKFGFTEDEQNTILSAFITSGQNTAGGVMQAVTAAAQTVGDADRATTMQESALDVLDFVAAGN